MSELHEQEDVELMQFDGVLFVLLAIGFVGPFYLGVLLFRDDMIVAGIGSILLGVGPCAEFWKYLSRHGT